MLTTLYARHEDARARRWRRRQSRSTIMLRSWRHRTPTLRLIAALYGCQAAALICGVIALWWTPAFLGCLAFLLLTCIPWTLLRLTIDAKDDAPESVLYEYEQQVIASWNRLALRLLGYWVSFCAILLVFSGTLDFPAHLGVSPTGWNVVFGEIVLISSLSLTSLPAVGYALTFNTDKE
ncbi:hypothetical protein V5S96_10425 [Corynebacterium mastitidis]|uniref:Uncharacterized protein n=1 Tax=Corynebacterium mastitidis TaxID=161890 RepID=A0ABU8P0Z8_9CORY